MGWSDWWRLFARVTFPSMVHPVRLLIEDRSRWSVGESEGLSTIRWFDIMENPNQNSITGWWWLEVWNHGILWLSRNSWEWKIIPTDELTPWFFRGVGGSTTNQYLSIILLLNTIDPNKYWRSIKLGLFMEQSAVERMISCHGPDFLSNFRRKYRGFSIVGPFKMVIFPLKMVIFHSYMGTS